MNINNILNTIDITKNNLYFNYIEVIPEKIKAILIN